jgi:hypothetical protein
MSLFFVVTPVLAGMALPVLTAAVTAVATSLGYHFSMGKASDETTAVETEETVELENANAKAIGETLGAGEELVMKKEGIEVKFKLRADGRCRINVCGKGRSKKELEAVGSEVANRIIQQYVYNKIVEETKKRGFTVVAEETGAEKTIKLKLRKWV